MACSFVADFAHLFREQKLRDCITRTETRRPSAARAALVYAERFSAIFWANSATTLKTDLLAPEIQSRVP